MCGWGWGASVGVCRYVGGGGGCKRRCVQVWGWRWGWKRRCVQLCRWGGASIGVCRWGWGLHASVGGSLWVLWRCLYYACVLCTVDTTQTLPYAHTFAHTHTILHIHTYIRTYSCTCERALTQAHSRPCHRRCTIGDPALFAGMLFNCGL